MKNGLLLINLGTPEAPDVIAVRKYLREFLADKRVIDLPAPLRYLLLYCIILPFRPKQSAHAYQAIWSEEGSPLLIHSRHLQTKLQTALGSHWQVSLGMRYGNPSLISALEEVRHCARLTILPLYPQYSSAATGSSIEKVLHLLTSQPVFPTLTIIRDFHDHPGFINAQATLIKPYVADHDYVLFSYHGVPERHLLNTGCNKICEQSCPPIDENNQACYKAQCYATTRSLVKALSLSADKYGIAFQSRLGKTPWIKPYLDEVLPKLATQGIKRLAVSCPSFVADCLETLEEIGIRAQEQWQQLGGTKLTLIPCVNDSELWINALVNLVTSPENSNN